MGFVSHAGRDVATKLAPAGRFDAPPVPGKRRDAETKPRLVRKTW
jgi:hypothetical protein